jgi:hypothetical protein
MHALVEPPFSPNCVTSICNNDPYRCSTEWDAICVADVNTFCGYHCAWN